MAHRRLCDPEPARGPGDVPLLEQRVARDQVRGVETIAFAVVTILVCIAFAGLVIASWALRPAVAR